MSFICLFLYSFIRHKTAQTDRTKPINSNVNKIKPNLRTNCKLCFNSIIFIFLHISFYSFIPHSHIKISSVWIPNCKLWCQLFVDRWHTWPMKTTACYHLTYMLTFLISDSDYKSKQKRKQSFFIQM